MKLLTFALLAVLAIDEEPKATIAGPKSAAVGDLIVLDASGSKAADFAWLLVNSPKSFLAIDGGRKCVFASGDPGTFVFVLAVAGKDRVSVAVHAIEVKGKPAPPDPKPPTPTPNPPAPGPDLPVGRFGLSRFAFDSATKLVTVDAKTRAEQAARLAESLRSVASAIVAGGLTDLDAVLEQTRTANNQALGNAAEAWKDWATELATKLDALDAEGKLKTTNDFAEAWRELATGLEALKQLK